MAFSWTILWLGCLTLGLATLARSATESTTTTAPKATHETPAVGVCALSHAGEGAMVTLVAGETRLVAHRAFLAARSPVFKAMLSDNTLGTSSAQLDIADVEGPVLRQLLVYMYSLRAPQVSSMAPQLLAAADKFGVSGLKEACERQLVAQLAVENAASSAVLALTHNCPRLKEAAVAFIRDNFAKVVATQAWRDTLVSRPEDIIVLFRLLSGLPADKSTAAATEDRSTPELRPHTGYIQTTVASKPATVASSTSIPGGGTVSSYSTAAATEDRSTPEPRPHTGNSQTTIASKPATFASTTLLPGGGTVSSYSTVAATESGFTTEPQPHTGNNQTTVASKPATVESTTLLPGGGTVSSYSTPAAAGSGSDPGQTHSGSSQTPAASTPAPPACNASLPGDDDRVSRYRRLSAAEKGGRLIQAASNGAVGELRALLAAGADVAATDERMLTALHHAAAQSHVEAARWLLACGADVDAARNRWQQTPLHQASYWGHVAVVRLLLDASADANAKSEDGWTPLHMAAQQGHAAVVRLLVEAGADVNAKGDNEWAPLHFAADLGHAEAAAALLEAGADRGATNCAGETPLAVAKRENHKALVDLLTRS